VIIGYDTMQNIEDTINALRVRRDAKLEDMLCRQARRLEEFEKLQLVRELTKFNVILAPSIGARIHLDKPSQRAILIELLSATAPNSNTIRFFVQRLFSVRLGSGEYLRLLLSKENSNPYQVSFAAYYFPMGRCKKSCRAQLRQLHERVITAARAARLSSS
jgi:hypothetical protein